MKKKLWLGLGLGVIITILLRIPSLFEPYSYADEGIYLVLGKAFREGLVFYKDMHDNKPPLLYVTAGLAGSLQMFRVILMIGNLINLWLIWLIAKKLFKGKVGAVVVSTVVFAILSSLTVWEGNIANGENFMIIPFTAGVYVLLLGLERRKSWLFFMSGLLVSVGFLFKVPVMFDLAGLGLFLWWDKLGELKEKGKELLSQWWWMILGFLLPNLAVGGYYFSQGAGERYLGSALLQNMPYLTSWGGEGGGGSILENGLVQRGLVLLVITGVIFWQKKKMERWEGLLSLWFVWGMFGVLLSERPYPHYFLEIVPVLSLIFGWSLMKGKVRKIMLLGALGLIAVSYGYYRFWAYPVAKYYENFWQWSIGKKSKIGYMRYWGESVLMDYKVGEYIKEITEEKDRIYVWGTAPGIYYLSDRLPVGRYTVAYHVADFDGYEETMEAIKKNMPKVIVKLQLEKLEFAELFELMEEEYVLDRVIGNREIYLTDGE